MVLRRFLLTLSRNPYMQHVVMRSAVSRRVARRFVAGETVEEALAVARTLNRLGIQATLNHLGENVTTEAEAIASRDAYLHLLDAIASARLESDISVKLTQLGLDIGDAFCYGNLAQVVEQAAAYRNRVWVDMEGSAYTERTLDLYRRIRQRFDNVGVAIQAYLYRSRADVESLIEEGIACLRLCKGAYDEPPSVAYPVKRDVDENLIRLARMMLESYAQAQGVYLAMATHDQRIINWVRAYVYHHQVPAHAFEFQMLYGVRRDLQQWLADEGYRVRVYVPYGTHWYAYSMRRLAERPANLAFFLRALIEA